MREDKVLIALNTIICQDHKYHPYIIQQIHHTAHIQYINEDNHFTFLLFNVRAIWGRDGIATHNHAIIQIISNIFIKIIFKNKTI